MAAVKFFHIQKILLINYMPLIYLAEIDQSIKEVGH